MSRLISTLILAAAAFIAVLATPPLASADSADHSPALWDAPIEPAAEPVVASDTERRARVALDMRIILPSKPIGIVNPLAMLSAVDDAELEQLRADLLSLSAFVADLAPTDQVAAALGPLNEDGIQAITDQQLTVLHNTIPDIVTFHLTIASLRESSRQSAARRAARQNAASDPSDTGDASRRHPGDPSPPQAASPERLMPVTKVNGTPLTETISDPVQFLGACPDFYYDAQTIRDFHILRNTLQIAVVLAKAALDAATVEIFGAGTNAPFVVVYGILRVALDATNFGLTLVELCDSLRRATFNDVAYANLLADYKNLSEHDMLEKAMVREFRQAFIRQEVEQNLLQTGDLRISLFQLPMRMMLYEGVGITVTQSIVLDTIQRNQLAGMPIGNAQALYDEGGALLAQNKYKDAYARFRSAYQAAVNQTVR